MKKTLKKVLIIAILIINTACGVIGDKSIFTDIPKDHFANEIITKMEKENLLSNLIDNEELLFYPDKVITKAEFLSISMRMVLSDNVELAKTDNWKEFFYQFAIDNQFFTSLELEKDNLDEPITREEAALILIRCIEKNGENPTIVILKEMISDFDMINTMYHDDVMKCVSIGLLSVVDSEGNFLPKEKITRAEAMLILWKVKDKSSRSPYSLEQDSSNFTKTDNEIIHDKQNDNSLVNNNKIDNVVNNKDQINKEENEKPKYPWEEAGKKPADYTWEEYRKLTAEHQKVFEETFDSYELFDQWMENAMNVWLEQLKPNEPENDQGNNDGQKYPWETGGKKPNEYTWKEFEALSDYEQEAFANWFNNIEEFESWMKNAIKNDNTNSEKYPWETGGKKPNEYTWKEFEALSDYEQEAFFNWFDSTKDFESWMNEQKN